MKNVLKEIFKKERGIIIGAIHLPPLPGYAEFPGMDVAMDNALVDLGAFEKGGTDGVIFENNYDYPHHEIITKEAAEAMLKVGSKLYSETTLPLGVSVLWNDYKTALSISKSLGLKFIRVPAFVDKVKTSYGVFEGKAREITDYRKSIGADNVSLFTDIHVKHSEILSPHTLVESAKLAIEQGSDALILTGNWTGQAPEVSNLREVRKAVGQFPILVGSGLSLENAPTVLKYANGAIVSTSVKEGAADKEEVNVKGYSKRILKDKVAALTAAAASLP